MNESKYCVIDNPKTMCREHWIDGRLVESVSVEIFRSKFKPPKDWKFFSLVFNYGDWETGKYVGDKDAML